MPISELKKALTSSDAVLSPYDLEPVLHEELLNLQPLAGILGFKQAEGLTHEYRAKTAHPQGWFEGETTPANNKEGTYTRKTVQLKIQRIWGSVTGFAQAVNERFINTLAEEISGSLEGMADLMEYGALFGCSNDLSLTVGGTALFTGDAYQYSGILPRVFAFAPGNVIDAGGDKVTLADLDAAIAKIVNFRQTRRDPAMIMMGLQMKQVVDGLQTKVQLPLNGVELMDGRYSMAAYDGKPIFETDYLVPASTSTSPSDLADAIAAGGSLADGDYDYKISSVTVYGEQVVSAASGGVTAGSGNNTANLTWTADANAVEYMIWRQDGGTGDYCLLDIIPALTYDSAGTVNGSVEAYSDAGAKTPITQVQPLASGEQQIVVANINPARGMSFVGKVDDMGQPIDNSMRFVELARVKDTWDYMIKQYLAMKLVYPNLVSVIRNVKLV